MASKLFQTKSPDHLIRESQTEERRMKRTLSAIDLTCLGIGAIIGTGIFALTGTAAAGQSAAAGSFFDTPVLNYLQGWLAHTAVSLGRPAAGPAVIFSFIVAAIACAFAAFCYGELSAMIPVS
ncbi:MAG TPA: hypothetical protein VGQ40_00640, partial [Chthoniobacterales bacterium]|nr:hypothetical protein [Chthoniobacterales bacterium]